MNKKNNKNNKKNNNKKITKKNKSVVNINSLIIFIFILATILYTVTSIFAYMSRPDIETIVLQQGNINTFDTVQGLIIRDETVYKSTSTGTINFNYVEHQRVRGGLPVAQISNREVSNEIELELAQLNEELWSLQRQRGDDLILYIEEARQENQNVKNRIDRFDFMDAQNYFSSVNTLKQEVDHIIEMRNRNILTYSGGSEGVLISQINNTESIRAENTNTIIAKSSGILSFTVDGLEETLNFDSMNTLTEEQLRMTSQNQRTYNNAQVIPEENIFKIVESNKWFIKGAVPNRYIEGWEENTFRTIYIERGFNYHPLRVLITSIDRGYEYSLVIFRATEYMIDFIDYRNINFKTSNSVQEGFKIPSTSIVNKTYIKIPLEFIYFSETANQVKLNNYVYDTINIEIQFMDNEYAYIRQDFQTLRLGDELVSFTNQQHTYNLRKITTRRGVYVVTNGVAEFEKIFIDENTLTHGDYYIIDFDLNRRIRVHDIIIKDTSDIEEGMRIY
jgi:hypothetical protein